jgi:hypothetical protein
MNKRSQPFSEDERNLHQQFINAPFYLLNSQLRNACVSKMMEQLYRCDFQVSPEIKQESMFTLINETLIELIEQCFEDDKKTTNRDIPKVIKATYWQEYLHKHHPYFHLCISEDLLELFENPNIRKALINKYQQAIDCAEYMDKEYDREGSILSVVEKSLPMMMLSSSNTQSLRKGVIHLYRKLRILEENEGYGLSDDSQSLEAIRLKILNAYNPKPLYCSELFENDGDENEAEEEMDEIETIDNYPEKSETEDLTIATKKKIHWKL